MRIIVDEAEIRRAARTFMQYLKKGCDPVTARLCWRGHAQDTEVFWNARFRFWSAARETGGGCWIRFGMDEPHGREALAPVCDLRFSFEGFDPASSAFFTRFGSDILAVRAVDDPASGQGGERSLAAFLELHGHGPTVLDALAPSGSALRCAVVSSATSPELAFDVFRFVSAVNDHRLWAAHGLLSPGGQDGAEEPPCEQQGEAQGAPHPHPGALVLSGVREQLERHPLCRELGLGVAFAAWGGLCLRQADGSVRAVLCATADMSPESLYMAVGRLALAREGLHAAKILVLPGAPGPYLAQALFRHGVSAVACKLTQGMAVVLDAEEIFKAVQPA